MRAFNEKGLVKKATPQILEALRLEQDRCKIAHELSVGYSIADIVILRSSLTSSFWPEGPLSVAESAILSSLRRMGGSASVDAIAKEVFMQAEPVRQLLLGRLANWYLVRHRDEEFKVAKGVSQSEIIAIEAKLTRWREALAQAVAYRRYADRAFVLLPMDGAIVALQHKAAFTEAGVGLLLFNDGKVKQVFASAKAKEHTWHREFAISRIL